MLTIKNMTKAFGEREIFSDLNLTFEGGKIYAIIGASGSGKTTLLNLLAQLDTYDKGEIWYRANPIKAIKAQRYYRDHLGYLFQNFGLLESQSIRENLDLGLIGKKLSRKEKDHLQREALNRVNLPYLDLDKKIYVLSGGESQRVALAKIILKDLPVLLADEPTAAIDPENAKEIMEMLMALRNENRVIIIATHSPIIWDLADEVVKL